MNKEPNGRAQVERRVMRYRLLERGERIDVGDERLLDDCLTWEVIANGWEIGKTYDACAFVPMRRKTGG